ncbi:MAG: Stp1/IreP family PP2C-type Ser/Thr phosphatase [Bacilli bacterium]|nr:Stp1/IreP family PP2C-type Ser/Thr phosphatase [Bacilli bacterium]
MSNYLTGHFCYKTDIGKVRKNNEDQAIALVNGRGNVLLAVFDGMGGENKGEVASKIARDVLKQEFEKKSRFCNVFDIKHWIKSTIKKANTLIYNESLKDISNNGMGTTLTLCLIIKNHKYLAQIGDSRAYQLKEGQLEQLTEDQSYVAYLYRTGQIKKSDIETHPDRHVLLNALGVYPSCSIDLKNSIYDFNRILLCSDGLYNNVSLKNIESILKGDDTVEEKVAELIHIANKNGGSDNMAVVIWEAIR